MSDTATFVTLVLTDSVRRLHATDGALLGKRNFMSALYKDHDNGQFDLFVDTWFTDEKDAVFQKKTFSIQNVDFHSAVYKSHNYRNEWHICVGEWRGEK